MWEGIGLDNKEYYKWPFCKPVYFHTKQTASELTHESKLDKARPIVFALFAGKRGLDINYEGRLLLATAKPITKGALAKQLGCHLSQVGKIVKIHHLTIEILPKKGGATSYQWYKDVLITLLVRGNWNGCIGVPKRLCSLKALRLRANEMKARTIIAKKFAPLWAKKNTLTNNHQGLVYQG